MVVVRGEGGGLQVPARRLPRGLQPRPHLQPGQRARDREVGGRLQHGRGPGHQAGGWVAAGRSDHYTLCPDLVVKTPCGSRFKLDLVIRGSGTEIRNPVLKFVGGDTLYTYTVILFLYLSIPSWKIQAVNVMSRQPLQQLQQQLQVQLQRQLPLQRPPRQQQRQLPLHQRRQQRPLKKWSQGIRCGGCLNFAF